eukprot:SAG11_NODE_15619_length_571_cov_3.220339_1_plen_94_part_10
MRAGAFGGGALIIDYQSLMRAGSFGGFGGAPARANWADPQSYQNTVRPTQFKSSNGGTDNYQSLTAMNEYLPYSFDEIRLGDYRKLGKFARHGD